MIGILPCELRRNHQFEGSDVIPERHLHCLENPLLGGDVTPRGSSSPKKELGGGGKESPETSLRTNYDLYIRTRGQDNVK